MVECTLEIVYMDFLRLKHNFPGTLGVCTVGGGGSGICSAFFKEYKGLRPYSYAGWGWLYLVPRAAC